ncbi:MAG TPA: glutathione S-transferase N-terminal domain-containing protein [Methylotenera sp.]|nr:glutathione S-transferase N-terminal domain-containing protein [Methylotenera sp.]
MKLLYTLNSPYARKVRIVALEKHIELDLQEVVLADPECIVKNHNPLGKVPVLVLADGDSVYDSRVIVEYLDNHAPGTHLIPTDNSSKIRVRRWEALADGVCDAAVSAMLEGRKPLEQQSQANIDKQLDKVIRGLEVLNLDITKKKWCVNETFSLADIALGCTLGYLDLRYKHLNWQDKYVNLARHYSLLVKRPSFKLTMPVVS